MSTEANGATTETKQTAPAQLNVTSQFIRDLSFENIAARDGQMNVERPEIAINVNVDGKALGEGKFEVALKLDITAQAGEQKSFLIELDYVGHFTLANIPQEAMQAVLLIECPRLLFPFARRIIADATRDGGYPPLMLDPIDFAELFRQRAAEIRAEQEAKSQMAQAKESPVVN